MLVKWNPAASLFRDDSFIENFFNSSFPVKSLAFEPRIEIIENDENFVVNAELPGLNKEDFKLTVENDSLTLEGEKKYENQEKTNDYFRSERRYGSFKRVFRLTGSIDKKKIKADYNSGILTVTLPKSKEAKPKEIEINVN